MAQFLRPASDVSDGAWVPSTGADNYAVLDESSPDDGDYAYTPSLSAFTVGLSTGTDPESSVNHTVRYRAKGNGVDDLVVTLLEGATPRASWTEEAAAASFTTYSHTLTTGEADAITDYTALRLKFEVVAAGGGIEQVSDFGLFQASSTTFVDIGSLTGLTAGNDVIVVVGKYNDAQDTFVAGDLVKQAGGATVGTITLDRTVDIDIEGGTEFYNHLAIYRVPITAAGDGTLTLRLSSIAATFFTASAAEYSGIGTLAEANSAADGTSPASPADSGNVTLAGAGIIIGGFSCTGSSPGLVLTEDGAFTLVNEFEAAETNVPIQHAHRIVTSGVTDSMTTSYSGITPASWNCAAVAYNAE